MGELPLAHAGASKASAKGRASRRPQHEVNAAASLLSAEGARESRRSFHDEGHGHRAGTGVRGGSPRGMGGGTWRQ